MTEIVMADGIASALHTAGSPEDPYWSVGSGSVIHGRGVLAGAHLAGVGECPAPTGAGRGQLIGRDLAGPGSRSSR